MVNETPTLSLTFCDLEYYKVGGANSVTGAVLEVDIDFSSLVAVH